ncbi:hypothetical protein F4779DRAFT_477152 [Xylariaceae sp. FL0662B]|nr:hypothetical protein F4779DRAFT_477152 [Xylariaceae sp. FL0662B]
MANLTRVRDNQRRSRARRKEYVQELEKRVRMCELQGVEASFEIQQAARRVANDNKKLRTLLNNHGLSNESIDGFLRNGDGDLDPSNALTLLLSRQQTNDFNNVRPTTVSTTLEYSVQTNAHGHFSAGFQPQTYPVCLTSDTTGLDAVETGTFSSQQSTPDTASHHPGDRRRQCSGPLDKSAFIAPLYDTSPNYRPSSMDIQPQLEGDMYHSTRTSCPTMNTTLSPGIEYQGSSFVFDDQYSVIHQIEFE